MNEKSYTELMKIGAMKKEKEKEAYLEGLYIDMLLNELLLVSEKEKLQKRIDEAIDQQDKRTFLLLSRQLVQLNKRFGS